LSRIIPNFTFPLPSLPSTTSWTCGTTYLHMSYHHEVLAKCPCCTKPYTISSRSRSRGKLKLRFHKVRVKLQWRRMWR
jgi:hypothetical protein